MDTKIKNFVTRRNCDDVPQAGVQADGVYEVFIAGNFVQVYCEFNREGNNWLVSAKC